MDSLKTIEGKVRAVLQENEDARNDDMVLYLALCNLYLKDAGAMPLAQILLNHKGLGLPSFESVGRTRRKLQEKYPELLGSVRMQKIRAKGERHTIDMRKNLEVNKKFKERRNAYGRWNTLQSGL